MAEVLIAGELADDFKLPDSTRVQPRLTESIWHGDGLVLFFYRVSYLKTLSVKNDLVVSTLTPGVPTLVPVQILHFEGTSRTGTTGATANVPPDGWNGLTAVPRTAQSLPECTGSGFSREPKGGNNHVVA